MRALRRGIQGAWLLCALAGCVDPVLDDRELDVEAVGTAIGVAFLDVDASGGLTAADQPAVGLEVWLTTAGGGIAAVSVADSAGLFVADSLPVGSYRLRVNSGTVPTGALVAAGDGTEVLLAFGDTADLVVRLSFPAVSVQEARALPPGRRVFTQGIALNPRLPFGDGVVHLQAGSAYLRATAVDRSGLQAGDSVRFLGTTARSEGLPVLTDVRPVTLVTQAALVRPVEVKTDEAARARDGSLDAALVRIRGARIVDTVSVGADLVVTVNDGSGPVRVLLREFLGFNRTGFRPQDVQILEGLGLLVPLQEGEGPPTWRVVPRSTADLVLRATDPAAGRIDP